MYLAFYKGPADGLGKQVFHDAVCWRTRSKYSHVELVLDISDAGIGACWSSSARDGGVRFKPIDLSTGRWDIYDVCGVFDNHERVYACEWFLRHAGAKYDYLGLLIFVGYINVGEPSRWFCSEAVAEALQIPRSWAASPETLHLFIVEREAKLWVLPKTKNNLPL
jgi:hypothetical protein